MNAAPAPRPRLDQVLRAINPVASRGVSRVVVSGLPDSVSARFLSGVAERYPALTVAIRWRSEAAAALDQRLLDLVEAGVSTLLELTGSDAIQLMTDLGMAGSDSPLALAALHAGMLSFGPIDAKAIPSNSLAWERAGKRLALSTVLAEPETLNLLPASLLSAPDTVRAVFDASRLRQTPRLFGSGYRQPVLQLEATPEGLAAGARAMKTRGIPTWWAYLASPQRNTLGGSEVARLLASAGRPAT